MMTHPIRADGLASKLLHRAVATGSRIHRAATREAAALDRDVVWPPAKRIATPRGSFSVVEWGNPQGPPLLLVHGLNGNARYWSSVASDLAATRHVFAFDLRGHGHTGPLPGGYSLEENSADLGALLDALQLDQKINQIDLTGHSWGGRICLHFAAGHPDRVRRLVLVDPVSPSGLHSIIRRLPSIIDLVFAPERGPFRNRASFEQIRSWISWLHHAPRWLLDAYDCSFRKLPDGSLTPVLDEAGFQSIVRDVLLSPQPCPGEVATMPTMLVRASFSVMPFPSEVQELKRHAPQLRHERIRGEHSLHATNPQALARVIDDFLGAGSQPGTGVHKR